MDLRDTFELETLPDDLPARFNIAPSQPLAAIKKLGHLELLTWGPKLINVKVEGVSVKPQNRCLVVVDGFYEWRKGDRQPFWFHRPDKKPFALAGQARTSIASCAIVTCPAGDGMRDIHARMPLIVEQKDFEAWLAGEKLAGSLHGIVRDAVSKHVNSPKNDDPHCIEPLEQGAEPVELGVIERRLKA